VQGNGDAAGDVLIGIENLIGSKFGDVLRGDGGSNLIEAGAGDDTILGSAGNDTVYGGAGNDVMHDGAGADHFDGGVGFDSIDFSAWRSGAVIDLYVGFATVDGVRNTLRGFEQVIGTQGDDVITGSASADTIAGGRGDDVLKGGNGNDTFRFGAGFGNDIITDFVKGADKIDFSLLGMDFSALRLVKVSSDLLVQVTGYDDTLLVRGAAAKGLSASDFLFV